MLARYSYLFVLSNYAELFTRVSYRQYNTSLEEILAAMGENGERRINWSFDRTLQAPQDLVEKELGTGELPRWQYGNSGYDGSWRMKAGPEYAILTGQA